MELETLIDIRAPLPYFRRVLPSEQNPLPHESVFASAARRQAKLSLAPVAQLVEHSPRKRQVIRSIRIWGSP